MYQQQIFTSILKLGHFPAKTTFPKVDASIRFVAADSDRKAVIANLEQAKEGLDGKGRETYNNSLTG